MLPIGGQPLIWGSLIEAVHANIKEVAIIIAPHKSALRAWLIERTRTLDMELILVEQPEPLGVVDAIQRGRQALQEPTRWAVIYPDYLHLPNQNALALLIEAAGTIEGDLIGLHDIDARNHDLLGKTAQAFTHSPHDTTCKIHKLSFPQTCQPGSIHTTFGEIYSQCYLDFLDDALEGQPNKDAAHLAALTEMASAGALFGFDLPGRVLDAGNLIGYNDAVSRFSLGEAKWTKAGLYSS
jgi:UTP-glucose-1-phosphate uridylyltransferase